MSRNGLPAAVAASSHRTRRRRIVSTTTPTSVAGVHRRPRWRPIRLAVPIGTGRTGGRSTPAAISRSTTARSVPSPPIVTTAAAPAAADPSADRSVIVVAANPAEANPRANASATARPCPRPAIGLAKMATRSATGESGPQMDADRNGYRPAASARGSGPPAGHLAASLAAAVATCRPCALAIASSLAVGCRSPWGPAIVVAPYGVPPLISDRLVSSAVE